MMSRDIGAVNRKARRAAAAGAVTVLVIACVLLSASCSSTGYRCPGHLDLEDKSYSDAFRELNSYLKKKYAFTRMKGIDWDALYSQYGPAIAQAEASGDEQTYFLTLMRYLNSAHDGHLSTAEQLGDPGYITEHIAGGFGLATQQLDDGRVIANWVEPGGPSEAAGIGLGAEILSWDGRPIQEALDELDLVYNGWAVTTNDDIRCTRQRLLTRAPVGEAKRVSFRNPGATAVGDATLTARDDEGASIARTYPHCITGRIGEPVNFAIEQKMLEDGIGYLRVRVIFGKVDGPIVDGAREVVEDFTRKGTPGMILDLRTLEGGSPLTAAEIISPFFKEKTLFHYDYLLNEATGEMCIIKQNAKGDWVDPGEPYYIEPAPVTYSGKVVVLVSPMTGSVAECMAYSLSKLPNVQVLGFYGSKGAFGTVGPGITMPGDVRITWPFGYGLDENKKPLPECVDREGGIRPDVRVPLTYENAIAIGEGRDIELEKAIDAIRGI